MQQSWLRKTTSKAHSNATAYTAHTNLQLLFCNMLFLRTYAALAHNLVMFEVAYFVLRGYSIHWPIWTFQNFKSQSWCASRFWGLLESREK